MMRNALLALALAAALPVLAAEPPALGKTIGAFFALSVTDAHATAAWYRDTLGFKVVKEGETADKVVRFVLMQHGNDVVELIQHRDAHDRADKKEDNEHLTHGIFKVGFTVPDLDATYRRVKKLGVPITYELMPAKDIPFRSFMIQDNEGTLVQFFGK
jgi:catechol 2,3-dioxygenase-like lactoylglutathione lyase family enzyme